MFGQIGTGPMDLLFQKLGRSIPKLGQKECVSVLTYVQTFPSIGLNLTMV